MKVEIHHITALISSLYRKDSRRRKMKQPIPPINSTSLAFPLALALLSTAV